VTSPRRRALGQHFLADPAVAARIVDTVGATRADLVCEIGAGPGALTGLLAARAGRLVALEIDPALHARLARVLADRPGVEVERADALTFDYAALAARRPDPGGRVLVAGNLPYSVSKPILFRVFEARAVVAAATLMVQREVALRLTAAPDTRAYGALSVLWQTWADVTLVLSVPPRAFRPPPAVDSAVIHAVFRAAPRVALADPAAFDRVVKAAFAHRRKTLANSLRLARPDRPGATIDAALEAAGIAGGRRAETLTLAEFSALAAFLGPREPA
jgi:16S rRNA (adenine1518-N6/adenine1519-N6)-dimethyltransferase